MLFLFSVVFISAQESCETIVQEALLAVSDNCDEMGRMEACYGFNNVAATLVGDVDSEQFANPSDRVGVGLVDSMTTFPFDSETEQWGIALMNVQANIPNSLPGQNVVFVLMGATEVENAVAEEQVFNPIDGVEVTVNVNSGANIRTGPNTNYAVVGAALYNDTLLADGLSQNGDWLRVSFHERIAWISRKLVNSDAALDDLPTITSELRSPMQSFYLRSGIGTPECNEATDGLLVQTPKNIDIELTVNGANIQVGSTIVIQTPTDDTIQITVIDGKVVILDENHEPTGTVIYTGQSSKACLGDPDNRGRDGQANDKIITCDFSEPETLDYGDFAADFCELQGIPVLNLNYPVDLFCPGEPVPVSNTSTTANIGNASQSQIDGVDCSSFALLGPFANITPRPTTFSWTEAPGATEYELVFYNYEGNVAGTFKTPETSLNVNVGQVPTGSELAYEVRAYRDSVYACVTGRTPTIFRLADPNPPPAISDSSSPPSCIGIDSLYISYSTLKGLGSSVSVVGLYSDNKCKVTSVNYALLIAPDNATADAKCASFLAGGYGLNYTSLYANLWRCVNW